MLIKRTEQYCFNPEEVAEIRRRAFERWGHGAQKRLAEFLGMTYHNLQQRFNPKIGHWFTKKHVDILIGLELWEEK